LSEGIIRPSEAGEQVEASERFFDFFRLDPRARDPLFLQRLVSTFSRIPYENLSKIIRGGTDPLSPVRFRLPTDVMKDHIEHRLGGTCFSLTFFLEKILNYCGFSCYKVMANMKAGDNIHCAVVVVSGGDRFLIDPGYGLNRPVVFSEQRPVRFASRHGGVELVFVPEEDRFHLFTYMARERKWRYSFADQPVSDEDFERFWMDSFSKPSLNQICLYRASPQGHLYLRKNHLRITTFRGQRKDNVRENLHRTVKTYFGISPYWVEQAKSVLAERKSQRPPEAESCPAVTGPVVAGE
jgi:arylamine N-acetyltransferase